MSSNVIFSYQNHVDAASTQLSASASAGNLSISNVADSRIGKRHRTTVAASWGQADFGADKLIDIVALVYPRDTTLATGTVRHQFDADGGTPGTGAAHDSTAIDIGLTEGYGYHIYKPSSQVTARYWRWTYALTSAFADTGRAWAGTIWQPDSNFMLGASEQWDDLSTVSKSDRSGAEFIDPKARRRMFNFGFDVLSEADKAIAQELQRICGLSGQMLVIKDPTAMATSSLIGRMDAINPIFANHNTLYAHTYRLRESL